MARKTILSNYYLFDASEREVVIPGGVQKEALVLITNVTDNKIIYNFSDPELTSTEYHISTDIRNVTTTRVKLAYDTTSMSDTDKLQIVVDDFEETYQPAETYHDSVNKMRMSAPQSQIDTDFEYSTQDTKWEALSLLNNNPFAYKSATSLNVSDMTVSTDSREVLVSCNPPPGAGTAIFIQDSLFPAANGVFIVDDANTGQNTFTYTAKYAWTQGGGTIYDSARTNAYSGIHYTGSELGGVITVTTASDNRVIVTCTNAHGLEVGNEFAIAGIGGQNMNGSWTVSRVNSPVQFTYVTSIAPTGSTGGTIKLYPRPQGNSIHRAFDGGVKFSTNTHSKNQAAIRQTKRYFRYQSGKGVAFSTGSILEPAIENVDSLTASGNTITVVCAVAHNVTVGSEVDVRGVDDNNYNGTYAVTEVIDAYTFKYSSTNAPSDAVASGAYTVTPVNLYGTNLEIGMMDQQNGLFFRSSAGELSLVRRTSTFQLSGRVTVTAGSTLVSSYTSVNGQTTKFSKQLKPGDYIVLRGSSYRVDGIISDTQIVIFPDYRGPTASNVPVTKTVETEWKQSDWNIDRMDGSGKSGYTIDKTKMQMFYMDYSWYGAGFVRWGFRAQNGNVIYAHKIPNNNQNTEAYMRSGNLPARYEVNTIVPSTVATKTFLNSDAVLYVENIAKFPSTGTLRVKQVSGATAGVYEYVNYTSVVKFEQDVLNTTAGNNQIEVASTTNLAPGGVQPIIFDTPFSNVVANKVYYVASVPSSTAFTITDTAGSSTPIALTTQTGSALSPLTRATSGYFSGITREQSGSTGRSLTMANGSAIGTIDSATNIQVGQRVYGSGIPADTYVSSLSGTSITLSNAVTSANPTGLYFPPLGSNEAANTFTYSVTQPIGVELLSATAVPSISHWGSSVIMEGMYDDDRAYVYTVGTKQQRGIASGQTRAILALRLAPSVDNGITGNFATRELINRMQLVLRQVDISATGKFFVELVLNPVPDQNETWLDVGGTSLAQYSVLDTNTDLIGGEVIFGFYADNDVKSYDLSAVKEISNSILGGGSNGYNTSSAPNATGIFPDGPEVLAVRCTNIAGGSKSIDARFSWTEAQA